MKKIKSLKEYKLITVPVEMSPDVTFQLKSMDIEDIYEILNMHPTEIIKIDNIVFDTNTTFYVSLIQELQPWVEKTIAQCVTNYDDLQYIESNIHHATLEKKLELIDVVFKLSFTDIATMKKNLGSLRGMIEFFISCLRDYKQIDVKKEVEREIL